MFGELRQNQGPAVDETRETAGMTRSFPKLDANVAVGQMHKLICVRALIFVTTAVLGLSGSTSSWAGGLRCELTLRRPSLLCLLTAARKAPAPAHSLARRFAHLLLASRPSPSTLVRNDFARRTPLCSDRTNPTVPKAQAQAHPALPRSDAALSSSRVHVHRMAARRVRVPQNRE